MCFIVQFFLMSCICANKDIINMAEVVHWQSQQITFIPQLDLIEAPWCRIIGLSLSCLFPEIKSFNSFQTFCINVLHDF